MAVNHLDIELLPGLLNKAKSEAGARYSPGLKSGFPNIKIQPIVAALDGLARSEHFWQSILDYSLKLEQTINSNGFLKYRSLSPRHFRQLSQICSTSLKSLQKQVRLISRASRKSFSILPLKVEQAVSQITVKQLGEALSECYNKSRNFADDDKWEWRDIPYVEYLIRELREIRRIIEEAEELASSPAMKLANNPELLLLGVAGIGKTHSLCDYAEQRLRIGAPTLIFLAQNLPLVDNNIWQSIVRAFPAGTTEKRLVSFLKASAKRSKERAIIIIDGVNEGERRRWKRLLKSFVEKAKQHAEIGIVLSCRTEFQEFTIPKRVGKRLVTFQHAGFSGVEHKAQEVFFKYYKLPTPEVPLLAEEFSNPLFLRIFCESLRERTAREQHSRIRQLSIGQVGMTNIFEDFIVEKQRIIRDSFRKHQGRDVFAVQNWLWGSGRRPGLIKDVATVMVQNHRDYLTMEEFTIHVKNYLRTGRLISQVTARLTSEGVFIEGVKWTNSKPTEVIRFSFQRISDHLLVRTALKGITLDDPKRIRPLFATWLNSPSFIEALMIEFPIRSKGNELIEALGRKDVTYQLLELFISGLYWRESKSFTKQTNKIINYCLGDSRLSASVLEALFSLACKPSHPYRAESLSRYLSGFKMPDRDILWGEFLRSRDMGDSVYKLISWALSTGLHRTPEIFVRNYIVQLMWVLTSNVRQLRNLATKALVLLGERSPRELFNLTIESFQYNDPYVPERMLAASYGLTMRMYGRSRLAIRDKQTMATFARRLYRAMFGTNAKYATTHVLMRDYARRTLELMSLMVPTLFGKRALKKIKPPYTVGGIRRWRVKKDRDEGKYRDGNGPVQMDFGNYTLGRLVRGRQNYDFSSKEYQRVKGHLFWRIYGLGYSLQRFGKIDKQIAFGNFYIGRGECAGKTDRYGKKYSWIAFFEIYGYRLDRGFIDPEFSEGNGRPSDCDIDPSFPDNPHEIQITKRNFLGNKRESTESWIKTNRIPKLNRLVVRDVLLGLKGPWVLLDGYIRQDDKRLRRSCQVHINGRMVPRQSEKTFVRLAKKNGTLDYDLVRMLECHYTFAGEVSWAETWPPNGDDSLQVEVGRVAKEQLEEDLVLKKNGHLLEGNEYIETLSEISALLTKPGTEKQAESFLKSNSLEIQIRKRTKKVYEPLYRAVPFFVPVKRFGWESYHSNLNPGRHVVLPAREVISSRSLNMRLPGWDFYDASNKRAVIVTEWGNPYGTAQEFTYIRIDILRQFLREKGMVLYWCVQGERRYRVPDNLIDRPRTHNSRTSYNDFAFLLRLSRGGPAQGIRTNHR